MLERVLITGGAGYVGAVLTPHLLAAGYAVTVYDAMYFGRAPLSLDHPRLSVVEGDVRDTPRLKRAFADQDAVLHLACISNDPSFELDPHLSRSINYDCFEPMVVAAREAGVRRFVYASTSSVYGVSDAPEVREDHPLVPLTDYNRYKGLCEPLLWKQRAPGFACVVLRPATVCGYSPRTRLDLTVNILTNHAVNKGRITVFGGSQKRPNLHIQDAAEVYQALLEAPAETIDGETFNAGFENMTIDEIALAVRRVVMREFPEKGAIEIVHTETNDIRSYHINSDKIARVLGWRPRRSVEDAVVDLCRAFRAGKLPRSFEDDSYYNVRTMKARKAA
ncbi:MAG: NAD-dependent epimerase/dehydratase family protein [Alphaproteobacteria bacterium]